MALPARERASLAHELIQSLDDSAACALNPAQEAEIQRRVHLVHNGNAAGRPSAAVFADIKAKYR